MALAMRLNLSDTPMTAELLAESLARSGSATLVVNGNSMHPTLQMGWRVYVKPAAPAELKLGELAVFRGDDHLTVHRLVWRERRQGEENLVFRGDYNRQRERVSPDAVIGRVAAVEIASLQSGPAKVVALEPDLLAYFYRLAYGIYAVLRPVLPDPPPEGVRPGPLGRVARAAFAAGERLMSLFLPQRR
jgi:signal peptidase I